jgi:acetoin utilization deacetylase AcuC-like enzyme
MNMTDFSRRRFVGSIGTLGAAAIMAPVFASRIVSGPRATGYAYHRDFESFSNNSTETYLRAQWINSRLVSTGVDSETIPIVPYSDPLEYIRKVHTQEHIDTINRSTAGEGFILTMGQAAQTAVGYVLGAVDQVCSGAIQNAFCCIRPPGHHVQNSGELGFCCYANIVCAALFAREKYDIRKILIVDWDYHQGNGTHGHICGDRDILFFETYNPTMYSTLCDDYIITGPEYSFPADTRRMNIQMPLGSTNDDFERVFETKLVPAAERFKPELVLVSCGFDLKKNDALGQFLVTAQGVSRITRIVKQIADTYAGGKLVSILEGGYADSPSDPNIQGPLETFSGLSQCAENHIKTLMTGVVQPETSFYAGSATVGMRIKKTTNPAWRDGRIIGLSPDDGPHTITLSDTNGKVISKVVTRGTEAGLATNGIAGGRYIISIHGRKKTIALAISFCP